MLFVLKRIIRTSQARLELLGEKYNFSKEFMHKTLSKKFRAGSRPDSPPGILKIPGGKKSGREKKPWRCYEDKQKFL